MKKKQTKPHKKHISVYLSDSETIALHCRMKQECFESVAAYVRRLIIKDSIMGPVVISPPTGPSK
jgi:hypothetical protein